MKQENLDFIDFGLFENLNKRKWWDLEHTAISHEYCKLDEFYEDYKFCVEEYKDYLKYIKKKKSRKKEQNIPESLETLQMSIEDSRSSYQRKHEEVSERIWNIRNISIICLILDHDREKEEERKNAKKRKII